jgi:monofunctional biosynthetic peptidoglycan transglycosylase
MKILSYFSLKKTILICFCLLFIWFTPWIFVLNLGFLIYFPYEANGHDRFLKVTGPVTSLFSDQWTPSSQIPHFCKSALVAAEDETFFQHHGIDFKNMKKIAHAIEKSKKIKRGGSTITQQIVKNAFLSREKTYFRKAREIEGALLLNLFLSKDAQLTWYFNIIEFGPMMYGIQEAAKTYFHTTPTKLTPSQCIALATIIPSPKKWNKTLVQKYFTSFFIHRYFVILNHLNHLSLVKESELEKAKKIDLWNNGVVYENSKEEKDEESEIDDEN